MPRYPAVLAALVLLLAGCVLQSEEPVFGEEQAQLVFGSASLNVKSYSWKDGAWIEEKERLSLAAEGHHYVAIEDDDVTNLFFIPLSANWFAVQATEAGKKVNYSLALVEGNSATLHLLECATLKKRRELDVHISYQRDDCLINKEADAKALFAELIRELGEPSAKIEVSPIP